MDVFIEFSNRSRKMKFSGTVSKLLRKLKINPEAVIVSKNNEIVAEDEMLSDADEVKLLSVISGG